MSFVFALRHLRLSRHPASFALLLLAWLSQLLLPAAHAGMRMGEPAGSASAFCGAPPSARIAEWERLVPAELRQQLQDDTASHLASELADCLSCCTAQPTAPPSAVAPAVPPLPRRTVALRPDGFPGVQDPRPYRPPVRGPPAQG